MNIGAYLEEFLNWGNTDFYLNGYGELCFGHDMMDIVSGNSYAFFYNIIDDIRIGDNYILWYSDTDVISREEIEDFTLEELNLAYNEIFARHGHDFKSEGLKKYFNQFFWYNLVENKVVALEDLNEIERENLNIIKAEIDRKK